MNPRARVDRSKSPFILLVCMKAAVSVPDDVFADAERLAKRLKKSRSQLYSHALREFVARHSDDRVTEALDEVANVSQIVTVDKTTLTDRVGRLSQAKLQPIIDGVEFVLGR